jgi:hypothetical protein
MPLDSRQDVVCGLSVASTSDECFWSQMYTYQTYIDGKIGCAAHDIQLSSIRRHVGGLSSRFSLVKVEIAVSLAVSQADLIIAC